MKTINIKLLLLISVFTFLIIDTSYSQRWKRTRYELIYGAGTVNSFTDLGGRNGDGRHFFSDIDIQATRPIGMIGVRYKIKELLAVKLNLIFGLMRASDTYTQWDARRNRNAISNTFLFENSMQCEYSIQKERFGTRYTFSNLRRFNFRNVNVYVFAGVGGTYAIPSLKSDWSSNKSEAFHKYNFNFPMGLGLKYGINRRLAFGVDIGHRYTTSDYLEGFSDTHSNGKDSYIFIIFNLAYKLRTARSGLPKF